MMRLSDRELSAHVSRMRQRIIGMTGRPISLVLSRFEETASTDCERTVLFNPRPIELGMPEVAMGMASHEAGHILYSPWGGSAMKRAAQSGKGLTAVLNVIMDRKDDFMVRRNFPGAVSDLGARMPYVMPHVRRGEREKNPFTDFFYAAKAGSRPRLPVVWKCMKLIRKGLRSYERAGEDELLACAEDVLSLLRESVPSEDAREFETRLVKLVWVASRIEQGDPELSEEEKAELLVIIGEVEQEEGKGLFPEKSDEVEAMTGEPTEVGSFGHEPTERFVEPDVRSFSAVLSSIKHLVTPLRRRLELFSRTEIDTIRCIEEGEVDSSQLARLLMGAVDIAKTEVVRSEAVTLALAIDNSGSMSEYVDSELPSLQGKMATNRSKGFFAKQLGVLFNAALESLPNTTARSWLFAASPWDCGPCSMESGIASIDPGGNNCDSFMARRLVEYFEANSSDTMMAVFVSDGGPDSFEDLRAEVAKLRKLGVISVQFFIEGSEWLDSASQKTLAQIFDHQFVFDSKGIDGMVRDFGHLLTKIYERR